MTATNWTWDMLQTKLHVESPQGEDYNSTVLQSVEDILGHTLPQSYVEYLRRFGCGLMLGMIIVWIPALDPRRDIRQRAIQQRAFLLEECILDKDFLSRLIPFGGTDNGDILCWDPQVDALPSEMAIYLIDSKLEYGFYAGLSLLSFFGDYCIDKKLNETDPYGHRSDDWDLPLTFEPCK